MNTTRSAAPRGAIARWHAAVLVAFALLCGPVSQAGAAEGQVIRYGQPVGIFSPFEYVRLDIGSRATRQNVPASQNDWATRFQIRRLNGPSRGSVYDNHLVGIFSENGRVRLDIGTRAMKEQVPANHRSWATILVIRRLDGPSMGEVRYGHLVGIFSQDGRYRLDISRRALKEEVPASHESWSTQLVILPQ